MHFKLVAVAALVSFFANWQFAYQITYVNTAVRTFFLLANEAFRNANNCTQCFLPYNIWSVEWSAIVASFYPGTIIGFLTVPILARRTGVRRSLMITSVPAILGCLLQFTARPSINAGPLLFPVVMCVGRLLVGIQAGSSLCLFPLFIIEISPVEYRGLLSTFQQAFQSLATVIGFVFGSEHLIDMGDFRFEWLQMIAIIPSIAFFVMLTLLPETPRDCLLRTHDYIRAGKAITFYYGNEHKNSIMKALLSESGGTKYGHEKWNSTTIKGLLLGCIAAISFTFTADDLIDTFSAHIIHVTSDKSDNIGTDLKSDLLTILLGVILFISSIFGSLLIDKYGRRPLLIAGLIGTSISNSIIVLNEFIATPLLTTIAFALTKCFIGLGAGAPAWFLTSELVPPGLVSICQTTSTGLLLVATGIITLIYLSVEAALSTASILVLASGPALVVAVLLFLFLPETHNKSYDVISTELDDHLLSGLYSSSLFKSRKTGYGALENGDYLQTHL